MITSMEGLKTVLREEQIPFFSDKELEFYLQKNSSNYSDTAYECLIIKAENSSLNVAGLTTQDSSAYFRRLAAQYKPNHSGVLKGGY